MMRKPFVKRGKKRKTKGMDIGFIKLLAIEVFERLSMNYLSTYCGTYASKAVV